MHRRLIPTGLTLGIIAAACLAAPATADTQIKPRAGHFSGQEAFGTTPVPVTFTVSKNRKKVVNFSAQAEVKAGCTNHIQSFQAPFSPMPITTDGHFTGTTTSYPQKGVRVTVTGTFTSAVRAKGRITIHFNRVKGCNANRPFTAHRTGATAPTTAT